VAFTGRIECINFAASLRYFLVSLDIGVGKLRSGGVALWLLGDMGDAVVATEAAQDVERVTAIQHAVEC